MALDRHPEAERLAEYADGVLSAADRSEIERHLADCADCRAVVAETMTYLQAEPIASTPASRVVPLRARRWMTGAAAGLAAAAAIVVAVRLINPALIDRALGRSGRPELQELIAAVGKQPTRLVEGRLVGFPYGPPPLALRGAGIPEAPLDVRLAVAKIQQADRNVSAGDDALRGLCALALGDVGRAIGDLESATKREPERAAWLNDLSAAYHARGRARGDRQDFVQAVDAATRALALDNTLNEARFNRALSLSALASANATDAWEEFLSRELDPQWSADGRRFSRDRLR